MPYNLIPGDEAYTAVFTGSIEKSVIISYYNRLRDDPSVPGRLRVLIDGTGCKMSVQPAEVEDLIAAMKEAIRKLEYLREAIVLDSPYETVIALLFAEASKESNYQFRVFSTESAARLWLSEA